MVRGKRLVKARILQEGEMNRAQRKALKDKETRPILRVRITPYYIFISLGRYRIRASKQKYPELINSLDLNGYNRYNK